jgi:hypothetical protein
MEEKADPGPLSMAAIAGFHHGGSGSKLMEALRTLPMMSLLVRVKVSPGSRWMES